MWIYKKRSNKQAAIEAVQKSVPVLTLICRLILGLVFVFSGFVKVIDPLGLTYKIEDYLTAFGGFFSNFSFLALPLGVALPVLELVIGLNLLFKIKYRLTSILAMFFMLVMTPLTLYIALYNPVTDCGCFGDALVITNWQTFFKNVVLIILAFILLINTSQHKPMFLARIEWAIVTFFVGIGVALAVCSYNHLPLIDFRPYKIGVNIPEAMMVPEDAAADVYATTFIYEKEGVKKEFTLENYPKNDSTWTFVDQKTVLVSTGYKAPIHDFSIVNAAFDDITEEVIYNPGATYLLVMYDLNKASEEGAIIAEKFYQQYKNSTTRFYALTASGDDDVKAFVAKTKVTYPFCKTDPITLKTMIRANPGLILIKNGTITGKWHWRDIE